ncbi:MAG: hypothetical protein ACJAYG_000578 [Oceanicoccus sp.]|jgi:hypothetical protein
MKVFNISQFIAITAIVFSNVVISGELETLKTKNFDGDKFMFPADIEAQPLALLFLAMSSEQDNGQWQQLQLIEWHKQLEAAQVINNEVSAYHFPVMESPPFFVKGIIRNAMAKAYEGTANMSQSGVLYVDDLVKFARSAELILNDQPTLLLLSSDGKILQEFKGTVSDEGIAEIQASIATISAPAAERRPELKARPEATAETDD